MDNKATTETQKPPPPPQPDVVNAPVNPAGEPKKKPKSRCGRPIMTPKKYVRDSPL